MPPAVNTSRGLPAGNRREPSLGRSLLQLLFGPGPARVYFKGFLKFGARFRIAVRLAPGESQPEVRLGEFRIELKSFSEVLHGFLDSASESGRQIVIAHAAAEVRTRRFAIELNRFVDGIERARPYFIASQVLAGMICPQSVPRMR